ncbi:MAG: hypothetical protein LBS68_03030 [Puniceicoccales bacterium]|jgi:hypothetical protein|nr:hypothetical protein [Puniceicoccales bacterium]
MGKLGLTAFEKARFGGVAPDVLHEVLGEKGLFKKAADDGVNEQISVFKNSIKTVFSNTSSSTVSGFLAFFGRFFGTIARWLTPDKKLTEQFKALCRSPENHAIFLGVVANAETRLAIDKFAEDAVASLSGQKACFVAKSGSSASDVAVPKDLRKKIVDFLGNQGKVTGFELGSGEAKAQLTNFFNAVLEPVGGKEWTLEGAVVDPNASPAPADAPKKIVPGELLQSLRDVFALSGGVPAKIAQRGAVEVAAANIAKDGAIWTTDVETAIRALYNEIKDSGGLCPSAKSEAGFTAALKTRWAYLAAKAAARDWDGAENPEDVAVDLASVTCNETTLDAARGNPLFKGILNPAATLEVDGSGKTDGFGRSFKTKLDAVFTALEKVLAPAAPSSTQPPGVDVEATETAKSTAAKRAIEAIDVDTGLMGGDGSGKSFEDAWDDAGVADLFTGPKPTGAGGGEATVLTADAVFGLLRGAVKSATDGHTDWTTEGNVFGTVKSPAEISADDLSAENLSAALKDTPLAGQVLAASGANKDKANALLQLAADTLTAMKAAVTKAATDTSNVMKPAPDDQPAPAAAPKATAQLTAKDKFTSSQASDLKTARKREIK